MNNLDNIYQDFDSSLDKRIEEFLEKHVMYSETSNPYVDFSDIIREEFNDSEIDYILTYLKEKGIDYIMYKEDMTPSERISEFRYFNKPEASYTNLIKAKALDSNRARKLFLEYYRTKKADVKKELILGHIRFLNYVFIKELRIRNMEMFNNELYSYGLYGLIKAIENFNPTLGIDFRIYGYSVIVGYLKKYNGKKIGLDLLIENFLISKEIIEDAFNLKLETSFWILDYILDYMVSNYMIKESDVEKARVKIINFLSNNYATLREKFKEEDERELYHDIDLSILKSKLEERLATISDKERQVLELKSGINGKYCKGYRAIASEIGCTFQSIGCVMKRGLDNIRRNCNALNPYIYEEGFESVKTYSKPRI